MNNTQDWELLDPQLKEQINNLNKNIINLTEENKKINTQISNLNEYLNTIKKLNLEHQLMFIQIKNFLQIGREKYLKEFELIHENISKFEEIYSNKLEKLEQNINKHTDNIFDPNYNVLLNNINLKK
jgi:septal ring factor EnvC (AmiA/AmiB activator)